jgi:hypothetical protein
MDGFNETSVAPSAVHGRARGESIQQTRGVS